jgi:hypothetical protein
VTTLVIIDTKTWYVRRYVDGKRDGPVCVIHNPETYAPVEILNVVDEYRENGLP